MELDKELKNDLVASWNEVNEALTSLKDLGDEDIITCLPSIRERLKNAQNWLGKYVSEEDVLQELNTDDLCPKCKDKVQDCECGHTIENPDMN